MTTAHTITPIWQGDTVAVIGCGTSATPTAAEQLRGQVDRTIVVNHAHRLAPWADMLVALDANWPQEYRDFPGLRVTGIEDPGLDALYIGPRWERVDHPDRGAIEVINSGLTALRIAGLMGARRIMLLGFEPEQNVRFYDDQVDTGNLTHADDPYAGVVQGLANITAQLQAAGVSVHHFRSAEAQPAKKKPARREAVHG